MKRIETAADLRTYRAESPEPIAFIPTMGALHDGHLSLVREGRKYAPRSVVSIFVNPTQFGPGEDFERYPRTVEADLAECEAAGVDAVFLPSVNEMYPPNTVACSIDVPELTNDLEGARRPGHFSGVCRVVAKLLNMVQAEVAVFGQKDYQQLQVVRAMAGDLAIHTRVVAAHTIREADGLAMSSRNRYLNSEERELAVGLWRALSQARSMVEAGESDPEAVEVAMCDTIAAHHMEVDYAVVRHPRTLQPLDCIEPDLAGAVALTAARLGNVRLIDNLLLGAELNP